MREFDFDKIQQYELLEEIGRGGMGAVIMRLSIIVMLH